MSLQIFLAYLLRDTPFFSWKFWAVAYIFGATSNQNLFLAIHEISHNLAFKSLAREPYPGYLCEPAYRAAVQRLFPSTSILSGDRACLSGEGKL